MLVIFKKNCEVQNIVHYSFAYHGRLKVLRTQSVVLVQLLRSFLLQICPATVLHPQPTSVQIKLEEIHNDSFLASQFFCRKHLFTGLGKKTEQQIKKHWTLPSLTFIHKCFVDENYCRSYIMVFFFPI